MRKAKRIVSADLIEFALKHYAPTMLGMASRNTAQWLWTRFVACEVFIALHYSLGVTSRIEQSQFTLAAEHLRAAMELQANEQATAEGGHSEAERGVQ